MANCFGEVARSIALECSTPLNGGCKGRAVYIPNSAIQTLTKDAQNARILKGVTLKTSKKAVAINNASAATPFTGSSTTGNNDAGRARFAKVFACLVPLRGADVSADLLEPMVNDPEGGILIVEKNDRRGIGSFEVIGLQAAAKVDPASVTRDETANGGAWAMNIGCTEDFAECSFYSTSYDDTKTAFETLYNGAY